MVLDNTSSPNPPPPPAAHIPTAPADHETETSTTASTIQAHHPHPPHPSTSSLGPGLRPLYFAYGSNLSHTQMRQRCTHDPAVSAVPVAIARLDGEGWRWFICERGYANVVPPVGLRVGAQRGVDDRSLVGAGSEVEDEGVYGVLYDMTPADELLLDGYEGVDHAAPPSSGNVGLTPGSGSGSSGPSKAIRPKSQGLGSYNKWYVPAVVTKWLDDGQRRIRSTTTTMTTANLGSEQAAGGGGEMQTVLVYVDEERVRVGPPKPEYIGRMERGIREAEALGLPGDWVEGVMRRFLPVPVVPGGVTA
ncbi:hypothetical protein VTN00DRAFT_7518 [Thermoascus crustaceus]|uniref:uncharacterized protein n=1 Tax=Thermoascus crustaceus TaxID=5088 RepID=UPI00374251D5